MNIFLVLLEIGRLHVTGGEVNGSSTNQADAIDVASRTGTKTSLAPMLEARSLHASAAAGPLVFSFGGYNEQDKRLSSCEFYDSRKNT